MNNEPVDHRQALPEEVPLWRQVKRRGDLIRNPLVLAVVGGVLVNAVWAGVLWAYSYTVDRTHEYWKHYGAGIAAEGSYTNNPDKLREIIARVQAARSDGK